MKAVCHLLHHLQTEWQISSSGTGAGAAKSRKMINDSSHNLMMVTLLVCMRSGNENTLTKLGG